MWLADQWKDYEVLDTSNGEKLERWGDYFLVRPDPQVLWDTPKKLRQWKKPNGHYHRSHKGGGQWEFFDLPKTWDIQYKELKFHLQPFSFKHTGLFPEQAVNWDWFSDKIRKANRPVKVLNLFAYTGGATLAAAAAGASVTHVAASKGMVNWTKEFAQLSGLREKPIRWFRPRPPASPAGRPGPCGACWSPRSGSAARRPRGSQCHQTSARPR